MQVGTLSFSHPSFGVIYVLFIYPIRESLVKFSLDLAVSRYQMTDPRIRKEPEPTPALGVCHPETA